MIYNKEIEPLQTEPHYSWLQIIVISVVFLIVLYGLVKGAGRLLGSLKDSVASDPLIQSAITVAQIAGKLKY